MSTGRLEAPSEGDRKTIRRAEPLVIERSSTHTAHHKAEEGEMHLNLPRHQVPREFLQNVSGWAMGQKRVSEEPTT